MQKKGCCPTTARRLLAINAHFTCSSTPPSIDLHVAGRTCGNPTLFCPRSACMHRWLSGGPERERERERGREREGLYARLFPDLSLPVNACWRSGASVLAASGMHSGGQAPHGRHPLTNGRDPPDATGTIATPTRVTELYTEAHNP